MRRNRLLCTVGGVAALVLAAGAASDHGGAYRVTALVSDGTPPAPNTDKNLVNGWGVAFNPMGFVWVADNGTGRSTLYDGHGVPQQLVVSIPAPGGGDGAPTGIVFSGGQDFVVSGNGVMAPARFIFSTEDGTIAAWAPQVDLTHAQIVPGTTSDAIYKGLALFSSSQGSRLYATDFHNNKVDVFDGAFARVMRPGAFVDPFLPPHYAPFGIQVIDDRVIVTFAEQDADAEDEVAGPGKGFVDAFSLDGHLLSRVASRGDLNAPWGVAKAPDNFGRHGGELLIGNFGDGRILGFEREHHGHFFDQWHFKGALRSRHGQTIRIDGLWGMAFGNGLNDQPRNTLFFAAGPDEESHGVYGRIDASDED
jgi:uncharacterized protein (TIGR03118 family)